MSERTAGWHPEHIKAELRVRFGSVADLSVAWGFHRSIVSKAITNPVSIPAERKIAEALDVPLHELWPDRWSPDGRPIARSFRKSTPSSTDRVTQRQNREAA